MKAVLAAGSSATNKEESGKLYKQLDELYATVLATPMDEDILEREEIEAVQAVLWTVVCAEEPMTIPTLASFLSLDEMQVSPIVESLRSVLQVSESNRLVSILHASFPDYILDPSRCGKYYCNPLQHNELLVRRCFNIMKVQLRFNICNFESSFVFDKDVVDLEQRIANNISCELFYACFYWGEHLNRTGFLGDICNKLVYFLSYRLLFWIEVLNLKRCVGRGEEMLGRVHSCLPAEATSLSDFVYAARNFVITFAASPASHSTPHLYISTLPFTSKHNLVRKAYWPQTQGLVEIDSPVMERSTSALACWVLGSPVNSIAQSSDGKRIASGSSKNGWSVWDPSRGACTLEPMQGEERWVQSVTFSPDNSRIASGSLDCTIFIWDARNGNLIAKTCGGHTGGINSIAFSPDSTLLVSGSQDYTIRMWDALTGAAIGDAYKGHQNAVTCVTFSPNGEHVTSSSSDSTIRVWDRRASLVREPIKGHIKSVCSVAYAPDGLRLASGSWDCTVRVWSMPSGTLLAGPFEGHTKGVSSVSFSPNNTQIVSGSYDYTVRVWEAGSGNTLAGPFEGHSNAISSVLFTTDGTRILSGSSDGTIRVWDARHRTTGATGSLVHTGIITSVAWSPDGTRVASACSGDKAICIWDTHSAALVAGPFRGHTKEVELVAFSPNGARIVSGSTDCTLRTWDASDGTLLAGPIEGHSGSVRSVAFSPDGRQIASGSDDRTIRLWNSRTGASLTEPFKGHVKKISSIAFSPNCPSIASGSLDGTVRIWDTNDGTTVWTFNADSGATSATGLRIFAITSSRKKVRICDISRTKEGKRSLRNRDDLIAKED